MLQRGSIFFCFKAESYSIVYIDYVFFKPSPVDGHLGLFLPLGYCEECCHERGCASVYLGAAVNSFESNKTRSGTAGSYGRSYF